MNLFLFLSFLSNSQFSPYRTPFLRNESHSPRKIRNIGKGPSLTQLKEPVPFFPRQPYCPVFTGGRSRHSRADGGTKREWKQSTTDNSCRKRTTLVQVHGFDLPLSHSPQRDSTHADVHSPTSVSTVEILVKQTKRKNRRLVTVSDIVLRNCNISFSIIGKVWYCLSFLCFSPKTGRANPFNLEELSFV